MKDRGLKITFTHGKAFTAATDFTGHRNFISHAWCVCGRAIQKCANRKTC